MINEGNEVMMNRPVDNHIQNYNRRGLYFRSAKTEKPNFFNRFGRKILAVTDGVNCWLYTHFSQDVPLWPDEITAYAEVTHLEPRGREERKLWNDIVKQVKKEFPETDWLFMARERFVRLNPRSKQLVEENPELKNYNYKQYIV